MKNRIFFLIRLLTFNYYPFRKKKNTLLVLMFHQVNNDQSLFYPAVPTQVFNEMCHFMHKYYEVIHFSEVASYFSKQKKRPAAIITFDDGHLDILENALPILKKLNLKFTVNIDTEILETSKPQDFVRVYDILNTTKIDSFMNPNFMDSPIIIDKNQPINTENEFTHLLSGLPANKRRQFVEEMAEKTGMSTENFSKVVSAENVKELNNTGLVEFGSHSHTHAILTKLSEEELTYELKHSKEILEKNIDRKIEIIAYPNGMYTTEIDATARSLGYKYILKTKDEINVISKVKMDENSYERVNQYHQTLNLALAHTYGITKIIRKLLQKG